MIGVRIWSKEARNRSDARMERYVLVIQLHIAVLGDKSDLR